MSKNVDGSVSMVWVVPLKVGVGVSASIIKFRPLGLIEVLFGGCGIRVEKLEERGLGDELEEK